MTEKPPRLIARTLEAMCECTNRQPNIPTLQSSFATGTSAAGTAGLNPDGIENPGPFEPLNAWNPDAGSDAAILTSNCNDIYAQ